MSWGERDTADCNTGFGVGSPAMGSIGNQGMKSQHRQERIFKQNPTTIGSLKMLAVIALCNKFV